jgi:outer membrane protein assembly factor BamB
MALSIAVETTTAAAADRPVPPRLPIETKWTVKLTTGVATAPVSEGDRIFLALRSAHLIALHAADNRELWRIQKEVTTPFTAADGLVFIAAGEAIEALHAADGATAWLIPRVKAVAPLVVAAGVVFAVTPEEILAIRAADGAIAWRKPAGGVRLAPAVDGTRVYVGADDGRIVAMEIADGTQRWEEYVAGGVTSIAAHAGRVYAGAGDKHFHCLDARNGSTSWSFHVGAAMIGRIAVDDERVYFAALDNMIRALDRNSGNQQWKQPLSRRPVGGVRVLGHIVFAALAGTELLMLFDQNGARSGVIPLPAELARDTPPDLRETDAGLELFIVTGGLSNEWQLTHVGPAGEAPVVPFSSMSEMPGVAFLTDPLLAPLAQVLPDVFGDPVLQPPGDLGWPIRMDDPPLVPLTTLPGLQLRPLSPVLPSRRGASPPGA